jgi:hypothetical protein
VSQPGIKQLTPAELQTQLRFSTLTFRDQAFLTFIQGLRGLARKIERLEKQAAQTNQILTALGNRTTTLEEQAFLGASLSIAKVSIDRPALVDPILTRAKTVEHVRMHLAHSTCISVIGEPGAGKTQLCLLTTETTSTNAIGANLRCYSPEMACDVIDQVIESASGFPFHIFLFPWYQEATSRLGAGKIFVLDDLPRVAPGGTLSRRLDAFAAAVRVNAQGFSPRVTTRCHVS